MPLPICSVNLAPSVHPGDLRNPNGYRWMRSQVLVFKHCQRPLRQLRRSCCMCLAILVPTALRHQVMIFSTSTLWTYFWSLYWAYFWPGLKMPQRWAVRRYNLQDFNETQQQKFKLQSSEVAGPNWFNNRISLPWLREQVLPLMFLRPCCSCLALLRQMQLRFPGFVS